MFHYDAGLVLTAAELAVDVRRRRAQAFISHAHYDHMAGHALALCTPATASLYQLRFGQRPTISLPYGQETSFRGLTLKTFPAGHCLGSAMLWAHDGSQSLLYTGDFKLSASATAARAAPPQADILVMESTYGDPRYRLPPREEVIADFLALVRQTLESQRVPVILAYPLGKSQEVTRILTQAGISVLQHPDVYRVSRAYVENGVDLGEFMEYSPPLAAGRAVIVPPQREFRRLPPRAKQVRFCITGWAIDPSVKFRWGADHAIPLSDHADYDELFRLIEQVAPRVVYCTHGPETFADHVRAAGWEAYTLGKREAQQRLF